MTHDHPVQGPGPKRQMFVPASRAVSRVPQPGWPARPGIPQPCPVPGYPRATSLAGRAGGPAPPGVGRRPASCCCRSSRVALFSVPLGRILVRSSGPAPSHASRPLHSRLVRHVTSPGARDDPVPDPRPVLPLQLPAFAIAFLLIRPGIPLIALATVLVVSLSSKTTAKGSGFYAA